MGCYYFVFHFPCFHRGIAGVNQSQALKYLVACRPNWWPWIKHASSFQNKQRRSRETFELNVIWRIKVPVIFEVRRFYGSKLFCIYFFNWYPFWRLVSKWINLHDLACRFKCRICSVKLSATTEMREIKRRNRVWQEGQLDSRRLSIHLQIVRKINNQPIAGRLQLKELSYDSAHLWFLYCNQL